jgi:DnaK suppressor protein
MSLLPPVEGPAVSSSLSKARMSKRSAKQPIKAKAPSVARAEVSRAVKRNGAAAPKTKPVANKKAIEKKPADKQAVVKQKVAGKKMTARAKSSSIVLPPDYRPSEDEPFMNERQRMYFRQKLVAWKDEIIRQTRETLVGLHEESTQHADLADRATSETDRALELRARDRQRKLVAKIDAALSRIEDGSYGYCEETGEPIGLKRLDARPIATLSVEAQERHERRERVYRED